METSSRLCVGIDPHPALLRDWGLADSPAGLEAFSKTILEASAAGGAAAVKPQSALFERHGSGGVAALERLLGWARDLGVLTILDVKRGDIGSTMTAYAQAYLDDDAPLAADAVTLSPYLGFDSLTPAFEAARASGRGVFVLAFTSNPEGRIVQAAKTASGLSVGESIIQAACEANAAAGGPGRRMGDIGLVIGATIGSLPPAGGALLPTLGAAVLAPGVGAQGAGPEELRSLFGDARRLVLATSSRGVAKAGPDPERVARAVRRAAADVAFSGK
jgi:orotidine-5'-phosphate decarboxylase